MYAYTLHIIPLDIASILHMATFDLRMAEYKLYFKRNNILNEQLNQIENVLIDFLNYPKSSDEIENQILEVSN